MRSFIWFLYGYRLGFISYNPEKYLSLTHRQPTGRLPEFFRSATYWLRMESGPNVSWLPVCLGACLPVEPRQPRDQELVDESLHGVTGGRPVGDDGPEDQV